MRRNLRLRVVAAGMGREQAGTVELQPLFQARGTDGGPLVALHGLSCAAAFERAFRPRRIERATKFIRPRRVRLRRRPQRRLGLLRRAPARFIAVLPAGEGRGRPPELRRMRGVVGEGLLQVPMHMLTLRLALLYGFHALHERHGPGHGLPRRCRLPQPLPIDALIRCLDVAHIILRLHDRRE